MHSIKDKGGEYMNFFLNNRQIIKDLKLNTGTAGSPTYTAICTTSEIEINTSMETKTFYTFCDAIQRALVTGAELSLECTVKLDINNEAIQNLISKIHTLIASGEIAQFNNETIQFSLLSGIDGTTLEYTTYTAPATLEFSDLGGAAEDEGEFSLTIHINGTATAQ
jgi:hypothetical protein